ncbi:MAG: metal-sulfur cluster assembly factor [Candidatus Moraniibacteriota bacterium]|nr:MAG: metal-sulfur cluster assembly factor [Candidatus Moranbacteria bacterium]
MEIKENILRKKIARQIYKVLDPELFISIVDLGLIYGIQIKGKEVLLTMTLTTIGCPLFESIEKEIRSKILSLQEVQSVSIQIVFDPPWSVQMASPKALAELGL